SVLRLDDEYPLRDQVLTGVIPACGRRSVDVDVATVDRPAGVLGDEPAAVAVVLVSGDVDAAAERDHLWVDGNRAVELKRERCTRRERHARQRDVLATGARRPAAGLQWEGDAAGAVGPVIASAPVRRTGRPAIEGRGRLAGARHPAPVAERIDVV